MYQERPTCISIGPNGSHTAHVCAVFLVPVLRDFDFPGTVLLKPGWQWVTNNFCIARTVLLDEEAGRIRPTDQTEGLGSCRPCFWLV